MNLIGVFNQVVILFVIILVGLVIRKKNIINKEITKGLTSILIKVCLPAMIIDSMLVNYSAERLKDGIIVLLFSIVSYSIIFVIAYLLPNFLNCKKEDKGVYSFMLMFSNVAFMGYPVVKSILGEEALFYAAIFNLPFNLLVFTIGVLFLNKDKMGDKSIVKLFFNMPNISVIIGFIIFIFSIKLPTPVLGVIEELGKITSPLSMIIIGSILSETSIKNIIYNKNLYIISLFRLVIIPFILFVIFSQFTQNTMILLVPVVLFAMPVAANIALISTEYDVNSKLASESICLTTILSMITIPIMTYLFSLI